MGAGPGGDVRLDSWSRSIDGSTASVFRAARLTVRRSSKIIFGCRASLPPRRRPPRRGDDRGGPVSSQVHRRSRDRRPISQTRRTGRTGHLLELLPAAGGGLQSLWSAAAPRRGGRPPAGLARCTPRRVSGCARCVRTHAAARWPEGPVCDQCYTAASRRTGICARLQAASPPGCPTRPASQDLRRLRGHWPAIRSRLRWMRL